MGNFGYSVTHKQALGSVRRIFQVSKVQLKKQIPVDFREVRQLFDEFNLAKQKAIFVVLLNSIRAVMYTRSSVIMSS